MILREFGIYAAPTPLRGQRPIHDQTRCVLALFERFLPRVDTDDIWKVSVHLSADPPDSRILDELGAARVPLPHDPRRFYDLAVPEKKRITLDLLERGLELARTHFGWPAAPFASAALAVREADFSNTWSFDPKWSPGRRFRAHLHCEHEPDVFRGELRVESREGEVVARRILLEEIPSEFCFVPRLGRIKWLDRARVVLLDRQGRPVGAPLEAPDRSPGSPPMSHDS